MALGTHCAARRSSAHAKLRVVKLRVLALDYDGTIAQDGIVPPEVRAAIVRAREKGLCVVLVTGRILSDLREVLGDLRLFDAVVAENGAVVAFPQVGRSAVCAPRGSPALLAALRARGIEARAGECIIELDASAAHTALDAIHELQAPLTLHFNRGRLMVLPQAVSKATGLREALRALRLSAHNAIGLGDAENDHELLSACEFGLAVAWGSAALQVRADRILPGRGPRDTVALIDELALSQRIDPPRPGRHEMVLGRTAAGKVVSLPVRGRNLLLAGDPRSGKSWVAGLLCEELILQGYCLCILDPEGDYTSLEPLPGVLILGDHGQPPTMNELVGLLRHADVSVIVDLARLPVSEKREYAIRALQTLRDLRRETGLPHQILVDEAHYFLCNPDNGQVFEDEFAGLILVTYRASELHASVRAASEYVIVTRETDPREAHTLRELWRGEESMEHWEATLRDLAIDEAVLLPASNQPGDVLKPFRVARRLTQHVHHKHKYMDVPVGSDIAFRFVLADGRPGPVAGSLQELVDALAYMPSGSIEPHIVRGDLSRWVADVFRDRTLATELRELEEGHRLGQLPDFNGSVIHAVQQRYGVT
jgi:hydroxymethylpyrimidine pyrophosphatase-like HAD family hydrolase